jgi:hypothetical protein
MMIILQMEGREGREGRSEEGNDGWTGDYLTND